MERRGSKRNNEGGLWTEWRTRRFGYSFVALFGKSHYRWNALLVSLALSVRTSLAFPSLLFLVLSIPFVFLGRQHLSLLIYGPPI